MKKYLYWGTTALVALFMIASGSAYFVVESMAENFDRLGFPDYFRIELGAAKIVGAIALLAPIGRSLKEWTYAGFTITFVSAAIAHLAAGDPVSSTVPPLIALTLLLVSYSQYHGYYLADDATKTEEGQASASAANA